jgi:hypothetical protein
MSIATTVYNIAWISDTIFHVVRLLKNKKPSSLVKDGFTIQFVMDKRCADCASIRLHHFGDDNCRKVLGTFGGLTGKATSTFLWTRLSMRFARAASGNVSIGIGATFRGTASVLYKNELPILIRSFRTGRVRNITPFRVNSGF